MEWMILPLRRYADFNGRSRRKEFWMFFLFQFLVQFAWLVLFFVYIFFASNGLDVGKDNFGTAAFFVFPIIWLIMVLATLIPNAAIVARRFQDQNLSGAIGIVLYVGTIFFNPLGLVVLVFMCIEGTKGENQYGEDPKLDENIGEVFR